MKVLLAVGLLLGSVSVLAESKRDIYDLMYLPKAGTVFGLTDLVNTNQNIYTRTTKSDVNGNSLEQQVGYSIMDNLSVTAAMDWTNASQKTSGEATNRIEGLSDPSLQVKYRVIDSDHLLDIIGSYTFSLGDQELNSDGTEFDNKQGGSSASLGLQYGQKMTSYQWSVLANFTHNMDSTTDQSGVGKIDTDAYNSYQLEGNSLLVASKDSLFKSKIGVLITDTIKGDSSDVASRNDYYIGGEYQYLATNDLLLRGGVTFVNTDTDSGTIHQYTSWIFNLGATYQF